MTRSTKAPVKDRLLVFWDKARQLARVFRVPEDPTAGGPLTIAKTSAKILTGWSELVDIYGVISRAVAKRERRLLRLTHTRSLRSDSLLEGASDPSSSLYATRNTPARLKAAVNVRLADIDSEIQREEDNLLEFRALKTYMGIVLEEAKAAKEVARSHVDLITHHRLSSRGEDSLQ